ncbi:MAG: redox-sensing transcriptional repressor Rex [Firmicutes bacterium]|nr:redox-sensing transcriptional repressor Rex [Clostridiales bacterium]MBQ9931658.1 redox-sensing transcriptional repressor Rex [Bacillota bacterium]
MKETRKISNAVIRRLPRYRRYLEELMKNDVQRISSGEFSEMIGYTASQIRQDLNNFGGFGQQGYGYNIRSLYTEISAILGLDREYKMIIIGSGNIGQALVNYTNYFKSGFHVCGMFDVNPRLVGLRINDIEVMDCETLPAYLQENKIDIAIICTPKSAAQGVADIVCAGGVQGIWNFAPTDIRVSSGVVLENVHLSESLHTLAYHINHKDEE